MDQQLQDEMQKQVQEEPLDDTQNLTGMDMQEAAPEVQQPMPELPAEQPMGDLPQVEGQPGNV